MTIEEELVYLREENKGLREQLAQRDELIQQQQARLSEQNALIQHHGEQMSSLSEQVKNLWDRQASDSHNSHLPPSSDRFGRKPKSLRTKSEKKAGGQPGHPGSSLQFSSTPDEITQLQVDRCEACQHDLQAVAACGKERRQVVDVPSPRLWVREYRAEQKQCPQCQQITIAAFPAGVQAPIQYGPNVGATAVYLVEQQLLPLARACEVMRDLLFVQMSEGTVWELIKRCAGQLATVEQQVKAALIHSDVIHQDETGLDVAGKRLCWLHRISIPNRGEKSREEHLLAPLLGESYGGKALGEPAASLFFETDMPGSQYTHVASTGFPHAAFLRASRGSLAATVSQAFAVERVHQKVL